MYNKKSVYVTYITTKITIDLTQEPRTGSTTEQTSITLMSNYYKIPNVRQKVRKNDVYYNILSRIF